MNRRFLVIATAVLAVVLFGGAFFFADRLRPGASVTEEVLVRPHAVVLGPVAAPVTIVEFLDPACEACRAFHPIVKQIMATFPTKVRVVVRYAALHQGSDQAVRLLEAARLQNRFEPVLEALFESQPQWANHGAPNLALAWQAAERAGLDLVRARADGGSAAITAVLEQDKADLRTVGVRATPTFFVNGQELTDFGAQQLFDLVKAKVDAAGAGS
ncbi:DsbA family protein [Zavarzinia sp. CC-PAN008]|uniref:DsbA family protein n=1 Tax=Zavarzinia sp. CC-PAN008 TaxID=3243332 RepID=UPI003F74635E